MLFVTSSKMETVAILNNVISEIDVIFEIDFVCDGT